MPGWYDDGSEEEYQMQPAARKAEKARERELAAASPAERPAHTPLPWEVWKQCPTIVEQVDTGLPVASVILPGNYQGRTLAQVEEIAKINAEFIVTACNNYEALKESHAALLKFDIEHREWCDFARCSAFECSCGLHAALANAKALTEGL